MSRSHTLSASLAAFAAAVSSVSGDLFHNGHFEHDPFDSEWSVSRNVAEHAGLVAGSEKAALLVPQSSIGAEVDLVYNRPSSLTYVTPPRLNAEGEPTSSEFEPTDPVWQIGFFFAVADPGSASKRSLNVLIGHDTPDPDGGSDASSPQINFRITGDGAGSAFHTGSGWQEVFPAGTVDFSPFANGVFGSPSAYYIQFDGDYSSADPSYRVSIRPAADSAFAHSAEMRAWQYASPSEGDGIIRIRFHGVVDSAYALDEVSPIYENGTIISLY